MTGPQRTLVVALSVVAAGAAVGAGGDWRRALQTSADARDGAAARPGGGWARRAARARAAARRASFLAAMGRRGLQTSGADDDPCLDAFAACEADEDGCLACLLEILEYEDDDGAAQPEWAPDDDCGGVIDFLHSVSMCEWLETQDAAAAGVCAVWDRCAEDFVDDAASPPPAPAAKACDAKACVVEHEAWLGDGVCDDGFNACYNTAACGWDRGDCCEGGRVNRGDC